jgi:2-hydroxychromene-2-carboxylate isomerase
MMNDLLFYFDFISPYAYVAWNAVYAIAARAPVPGHVVPVPILLAALLDANGQKGPAEIPSQRIYTFKDAYRKGHRLGLPPLVPPPSHPFNPLVALRVASLARFDEPTGEPALRRLIDALFAAAWRDGKSIEGKADVAAIASSAGFDGHALIGEAETAEAKARLKHRTADALARGGFGVPTLVVDGEIYRGIDSLDLVEGHLHGGDSVPKDLAWEHRTTLAGDRRRAAASPNGCCGF